MLKRGGKVTLASSPLQNSWLMNAPEYKQIGIIDNIYQEEHLPGIMLARVIYSNNKIRAIPLVYLAKL